MDAVLDEDPAALGAVPEPVLGRQVLVGGVILEVTVQHLAEHLRSDQAADRVVDGIVPLHQVGDDEEVALASLRDHGVGLFDGHRQRLLADHVLAGRSAAIAWAMVEERRCGDIDQVDVVASQQLVDLLDVGNAEPRAAAIGRLSVSARHAGQLHPGHLGELLERIETETTAADHAHPDFCLTHVISVPHGGIPCTRFTSHIVPLDDEPVNSAASSRVVAGVGIGVE